MTTSATGKSSPPAARRAFTLLELLLVLALLGMMLAIAWPSLNRSFGTQRLKRAADLVRTHLLRARTKAMTSGEIISFRFQIDTGHLRVEQQSTFAATLDSANMSVGGGMSAGGGMSGGSSPASGAASRPSSGGSPAAGSSPSAGSPSSAVGAVPTVEENLPEGVKFKESEIGTDPRAGTVAINDRFTSINDAAWSRPILFFPDGTATVAKIILLGDRERSMTVELRSLTGGVKVGQIDGRQETSR